MSESSVDVEFSVKRVVFVYIGFVFFFFMIGC